MTTPILFLLGAVALSALGGLVVWIASRPRPERFGSTIETFNRDLDALAPPGRQRADVRTGRRQAPSQRSSRAAAPRPLSPQSNGQNPRPRPGPRPTKHTGQR